MFGVLCVVCNLQCVVCSVQCVVCCVLCLVCSLKCAVCSVNCAVCSVQCDVFSVEQSDACRRVEQCILVHCNWRTWQYNVVKCRLMQYSPVHCTALSAGQ